MFKDKLKIVMHDLGLNQTKLSELTGIGKSSISQYLSGKNEPTETRAMEIASALGLDPKYFSQEKGIVAITSDSAIPRLQPEQVAKLTGMGKETVRMGLQGGRFPWGYAVKNPGSNRWTYWINAKRFAEIEGISLEGVSSCQK